MPLLLEISTISLSVFAFSPPISLTTCIYTAAKSINKLSVSPNTVALGVSSIVGTIALGFLTDNTVARTNSDFAFHNGDSLWKAPISLQTPTPTRMMTSSTPTLLSPECHGVKIKQILAAFATICALLVGSAFVMNLASQNSFSSSSEPARVHQHPAQRVRRHDPAPWPVPPLSRRPRSQSPNRRPASNSKGGKPRKANIHHDRPVKMPFREDPPPPPPPSLTGFIADFPKPKNFEELIIMNIMLGALFGWILKKLLGYFLSRKASQRPKNVSPPRAIASSSIETGDCSRPTPSRSRLPEQRQKLLPLNPRRSSHHPVSVFLGFALAGSGTLILFRLNVLHRPTNAEHEPNQTRTIVPITVVRPRNRDSTFAHPVPHVHRSPADTSYRDRLPRSQTTPILYRRQPSVTRRSPSAVRLSKVEQVKYFYKDEIIGFENGPRPRGRCASVS